MFITPNALIESIAEVCRRNPVGGKLLVAPSLRIGNQWIEFLLRAGISAANLRATTVAGLAARLAAGELSRRGLRSIDTPSSAVMIGKCWRAISRGQGYLRNLRPDIALYRAVWRSVNDLRLAGLCADDISADAIESPAKADELAELMRQCEKYLAANKLADYSMTLRFAAQAVAASHRDVMGDWRLLLPPIDWMPRLEREFLNSLGERVEHLRVDRAAGRAAASDLEILAVAPSPAAAPPPMNDGSVTIFSAIGYANEIRHVLRTIIAEGTPLDDVEIVYSSADPYLRNLYELAMQYRAGDDATGVPITFSDGIPAAYSKPARALLAWIELLRDDFQQTAVVRMIQDGLLRVRGHNLSPTASASLAGAMRSLRVICGADRYLSAIDHAIAAARSPRRMMDDDESSSALQSHRREARRLRELVALRRMLGELLAFGDMLRLGSRRQGDVLLVAGDFVRKLSGGTNWLDNMSRLAIAEQIDAMTAAIGDARLDGFDPLKWLATMIGELRVGGSGPRAGHIHACGISAAGHSGRRRSFLVGMDDSLFPPAWRQDPILLDGERSALSRHLRTCAARQEQERNELRKFFTRISGRLTVSFCRRDIVDDRELFPSSAMVDVWRIVSGRRNGDQREMLVAVGPGVSFAPMREDQSLDAAQWWLWRMFADSPATPAADAVTKFYPHLHSAKLAHDARMSSNLTEYDGSVPAAGANVNPLGESGMIMSAGRFKAFAECPMRFFFQYVLGVLPSPEIVSDPDAWMSPMEKGNLLHELFRRYVIHRGTAAGQEDIAADWPVVNHMLDTLLEEFSRLLPEPFAHTRRRQVAELRQAAWIFLNEESRQLTRSRRSWTEVSIGTSSEYSPPTELDLACPAPIELDDGRQFRFTGRIDRIDQVDDASFVLTDYKTGRRTDDYFAVDPFCGGRTIQHGLYMLALQGPLAQRLGLPAKMERFDYVFVNYHADRWRASFYPAGLCGARRVLGDLCDAIATGVFPSLPVSPPKSSPQDDSTCRYCDYLQVCKCGGDLEKLAVAAAAKLANPQSDACKFIRRLRGESDGEAAGAKKTKTSRGGRSK